jgi:hypothetical protein
MLMAVVTWMTGSPLVHKQNLAKLAGKLISIALAIQLAPLYTRRLFQAMGDVATWESALGEEQVTLAEEDLRYFQAALQLNAGWRWSPRVNVREFSCAGDASETGYGGHSALLPADMVLSFDARDHARMQAGQLSSTLREGQECMLSHFHVPATQPRQIARGKPRLFLRQPRHGRQHEQDEGFP